MPLGACLRRHTHRQFKLIREWLYNNDVRSESLPTVVQYLMMIGREVRASRASEPDQIKQEHFRIRYETAPKPGDPGYFELTPEMEEAIMRAHHGMGGR